MPSTLELPSANTAKPALDFTSDLLRVIHPHASVHRTTIVLKFYLDDAVD